MTADDDRLNIPLLGFVAGAIVSVAFVTGAFDALLSNHFSSWNRLTLRPEDSLARAIEGALPALRVLAMVGAAALGYTSLRRMTHDSYKPGVIRLGLIAFSPIIVEMADVGTQDGQVRDLGKLPIHSMILLVLLVVGPAIVAAWDARFIRNQQRTAPPVPVG